MMSQLISRRRFLVGGSLLATFPTLTFADQEPLVYKDWTKASLSDQINQTSYLPANIQPLLQGYVQNSAKVRAEFPPDTYAYGPGANERLDVFAPKNAKGLPVMIFIHGGAWTWGSKDDFSSAAPTFIQANTIYVSVNMDNIPPNTIDGMVNQCRRAIAWVWKNAQKIGADPKNIYVSGHSSGGHLANMMVCTQWQSLGLPADLLKGGVIMSGWSDLYPISLSDRQTYLKLNDKQIKEYSPINFARQVNCPVIISWGALESVYMQSQSAAWAQKLQTVGRLAGVYKMADCNHLQMPNLLNSTDNELTKATLALMDII